MTITSDDQSVLVRLAHDELINKMFSLKITDIHDERVKNELDAYSMADEKLMQLLREEEL